MKYNELPKSIKSPITGNRLQLMDASEHNDEPLSVAQEMNDCVEFFDPYVAWYKRPDADEWLYIPYEGDEP